jgi:putative transposase
MVEVQSMTVADVVAQVRDGRLEDFVREAVALVARELMEAEVSAEVGAALGEVAPEARSTHRNGYRSRPWETRVGEIELLIPKKRSGSSYFPSFLEPRRRSEQAIVAVVLEAYINGVSTRKVDRLVEQLGIDGMTKDRVSALCGALDEQVELFRQRPLEGAYPYPYPYTYLWLDAKPGEGARPGPRRVQGAGDCLCGAQVRGARGDRP